MQALAVMTDNSAAQPLYAIEEHLAALIETAEMVSAVQEQQFREDFQIALSNAVEKRDRVGQFMAHLQQQIVFAASEMERLRVRKATYQRALERLQDYVASTIRSLGRDAKGKYLKLEGRTVTFSLALCPPSVDVVDETVVPANYKTLTLTVPANDWEQILLCLDAGQRETIFQKVQCRDISIDKRAVKAAIQAGNSVPGADLVIGKTSLRRA